MTKSNIFALVTLFAIFGIAVTNAFHKYGPEFMDDDHPKFLFKPASVDVQGKRYIFKFGNIEYGKRHFMGNDFSRDDDLILLINYFISWWHDLFCKTRILCIQ